MSSDVPVYLGAATERILREAAFFSSMGASIPAAGHLEDRNPFDLGPFRITPYLMDHSAFDAYALLIEADGARLFYSGDLRAHGRKGALFERLLALPPGGIDLLLLEGTMLAPPESEPRRAITEDDVEHRCAELFRDTEGMALAVYSPQNVDRMVTLYRAALRAGRDFVVDLYTATVARATEGARIPCPGPRWPRVRVFLPQSQRLRVKEAGEFERVGWVREARVYPEQLADLAPRLVMTYRGSMHKDLELAGCLQGARAVWSLWDGYRDGKDNRFDRFAERNGVPVEVIHSSGHAFPADLARLVEAVRPGAVVPIHTEHPRGFEAFAPRVRYLADGEWAQVFPGRRKQTMGFSFDRAPSKEFLGLLKPDGDLSWLARLDQVAGDLGTDQWGLDVQLRRDDELMVYHGNTMILGAGYQPGARTVRFFADTKYINTEAGRKLATQRRTDDPDLEWDCLRYLQSAADLVHHDKYGNQKEGYWHNRLCHRFGPLGTSYDRWLIVDREALVGLPNQAESTAFYARLRGPHEKAARELLGESAKVSLGNELDILALGRQGEVVCVELKHGLNSDGIASAAFQAAVYRDVFAEARPAVLEGILALAEAKVAVGLLPEAATDRINLARKNPRIQAAVVVCDPRKRERPCYDRLVEALRLLKQIEIVALDKADDGSITEVWRIPPA